jgi:hypothetical protein
MTERQKPDLSSIEPIGRPPDADDVEGFEGTDGVRHPSGAVSTTTPAAVVVEPDAADRRPDTEPGTSRETEEQLDQLRRG